MSSHPNESSSSSRICAKAVGFERSVPVAEPDTLQGTPHLHDIFPAARVPCSDRVVLLEFN